ncbi:hypothetical protein [Rufibacter latericius]|uniref:Uncharacterized protein n=1 Tax=Rufibacter latericius TaxID=2487040 RepID=A0A3M9MM35_9BACT|nr:hypothetical protein [Rufibacter latericius]RNI26600.1 hypothetical protein EFB08_11315 [Rufibacter latericius]
MRKIRNHNAQRQRFMDRFLDRELTPAEELFALCNAYHHIKAFRKAAAYADTDTLQRHTLAADFGVTNGSMVKSFAWLQFLEGRSEENFGTRLREFIYNTLRYAQSFPGINQETFKPTISRIAQAA